ncbi:LPS-assembly protein [uncultured Gammaproteobacteria bacterium]
MTTVSTAVHGDIYSFRNYYRPEDYTDDHLLRPGHKPLTDSAGRLHPEGQVLARYPLVRHAETMEQFIEPMAAVTVAPSSRNDSRLPNEDSRYIEFSDISLFRLNRYPGLDRREGGQRIDYGVRAGVIGRTQGRAGVFVGQSHRLSQDRPFELGTGLENSVSDYVGRAELSPASWLDLYYAGRYDHGSLAPRAHSTTATAGVPLLRLSTNYYYEDAVQNQVTGRRAPSEYVTFGGSSTFVDHWSVSAGHSLALNPNPGPRATNISFNYMDECFILQTIASLDHTTPPGLNPNHTVYLRLVFRNLGEVTTPKMSTSAFGK